MELAAADRAALRALWKKLSSNTGVYTTEALERTFAAFPATRTYFPHLDLSPGSAPLKAHGKKVADALTLAMAHLDDLPGALAALRNLHTHTLRVDPTSFQRLGHCLLVTLARHFPGDFSPAMQASLHKFLSRVAEALGSDYDYR
ncbi:Hemoglobin subunit theta-1 [Galemys pyrenaicus]|uniref:Hemoglobin subunit theta-1 n=1 Tax=Galemys pyrenaicus TaxID=202257 RepID=A0A8J5ZW79_GALPY|nr:Hemoglobin subunit theta-1 [Galemys pyrenaicus]